MSTNDRLRAANAAGAERERLVQLQAQLKTELAAGEQQIQQLAQVLRRELADVERLTGGLGKLMQGLMPPSALAREQREAHEANARYQAAIAARDNVKTQLANVEARLASLTPEAIAREQQAARDEQRDAIVGTGGASAATLFELEVRMESIDIELLPLADALAAGHVALAKIAELVTLLEGAADERAWRKRADALAAETQARVAAFQTAYADLAASGEDRVDEEWPAPLPESWARTVFASVPNARASLDVRIDHVRTRLAAVRVRHDALAERRATIARERDELLVAS